MGRGVVRWSAWGCIGRSALGGMALSSGVERGLEMWVGIGIGIGMAFGRGYIHCCVGGLGGVIVGVLL